MFVGNIFPWEYEKQCYNVFINFNLPAQFLVLMLAILIVYKFMHKSLGHLLMAVMVGAQMYLCYAITIKLELSSDNLDDLGFKTQI